MCWLGVMGLRSQLAYGRDFTPRVGFNAQVFRVPDICIAKNVMLPMQRIGIVGRESPFAGSHWMRNGLAL
jgi:hypothetical protein